MERIQITPIQSADVLVSCANLLVAAYNAEPWNDAWTPEKALEKLTCFYNSPKFLGWTATLNGQLVGACVGNIEPYFTGDYYYLKEMFVSPEAQHQGIGKQLLATVKNHLQTIDIQTIILFTGNELFPFEFYLKSGFNEMEGMRMMHFSSAG